MLENRLFKFAIAGAMAMVLAACGQANKSADTGSMSGGYSAERSEGDAQYLAENVLDRVFFNTDQSTLNEAAMSTVRNQARWLQANSSVSVVIEGHADERGTRDYNLALGARRATAVRDALISMGVNAGQVSTISYGKERPVSLCSSENCWSKNRRAVTSLR